MDPKEAHLRFQPSKTQVIDLDDPLRTQGMDLDETDEDETSVCSNPEKQGTDLDDPLRTQGMDLDENEGHNTFKRTT